MTGCRHFKGLPTIYRCQQKSRRLLNLNISGTALQTLIAGLNVATGKIIGACGATRTEEDLKNFIERVVTENKGYKKYHFVGDQLNTHKSESLVVGCGLCGRTDVWRKGKAGILASMPRREGILLILIQKIGNLHLYAKTCVMDWIKLKFWFGMLVRKVIKRGNFKKHWRIESENHGVHWLFNNTMASLSRWTYQGKVMVA